MEVKSCLNTTSVKLPVTPRVNPPYLKCINMVEKYPNIRGVNPFLQINANMVGWPPILIMEFRSLIHCYGAAVFRYLIA